MVHLLLLKGADKDALDNMGRSPLYSAALWGHEAAALALIAAGVDVSFRCGFSNYSVVHVAADNEHVGTMRAVIERGADVSVVDRAQKTPVHRAALRNNVEAVDMLVQAGANSEARDRASCTPLHGAADQIGLEALLYLLKHGAQVNALDLDHQETPLHWAAAKAGIQGAAEVVDSLLRSGAGETILNQDGEAAADMVGIDAEEEDHLAEDVKHVRELLANAPADRAWRRRGYLVLCRAHPDRMQQIQDTSSTHAGMARTTRNRAKQGRT